MGSQAASMETVAARTRWKVKGMEQGRKCLLELGSYSEFSNTYPAQKTGII